MSDKSLNRAMRVFTGLIQGSPIHRVLFLTEPPMPDGIAMALWVDEFSTAMLGLKIITPPNSPLAADLPPLLITIDYKSDETKAWIEKNLIDAPLIFDDAVTIAQVGLRPPFGEYLKEMSDNLAMMFGAKR